MCSEKYKHEVSITIQISGSGNPRTVAHKLSTLAFTIPWYVRPKQDAIISWSLKPILSTDYAYPPPDSDVSNLFDGKFGEENLQIKIFLFFRYILWTCLIVWTRPDVFDQVWQRGGQTISRNNNKPCTRKFPARPLRLHETEILQMKAALKTQLPLSWFFAKNSKPKICKGTFSSYLFQPIQRWGAFPQIKIYLAIVQTPAPVTETPLTVISKFLTKSLPPGIYDMKTYRI
jgi:hypothetical protein